MDTPRTEKDTTKVNEITEPRPYGEWVKEQRMALGLDQQECADRAAKALGIKFTRSGWSKIENSPFRQVRLERVQKVAAGLGIPYNQALAQAQANEAPAVPDAQVHIADGIATARRVAGVGPAQVAAQLGVSPEQYERFEDGRSVPDAVQMFQLASMFGVPVGTLYGDSADASASRFKTLTEEVADVKDGLDDLRELLQSIRDEKK